MADNRVTPDSARIYTKQVADIYADATTALLRRIAARVDRGVDAGPLRVKLADVLALRKQAQDIADRVSSQLDYTLGETIRTAYGHGEAQAARHLAEDLGYRSLDAGRAASAGLAATKQSTVEALAGRLSGQLTDLPIARSVDDAYRRAVTETIAPASAGVETRRQASQRVLDRLAMDGLGSFTDQSGRRWRLDSYAEMATRTTLGQAALQGSLDRIRQTTPFVQVSDMADECKLCRPWEGKVLLASPDVPDKWADVETDGTVGEARSDGLFHPNCTHSLSAFIPGLTKRRPGRQNPAGDAARQQQRYLERGLRSWKRRQAVANTPAARNLAQRKADDWSRRLAEHTATTNRLRLRARESVRRPAEPPVSLDAFNTPHVDLPDMPPATAGRETVYDVDAPPAILEPVDLDDDALQAELAEKMGAGEFDDRLEALSAELDRRDQFNTPTASVPDNPDPWAEQGALDRVLGTTPHQGFGDDWGEYRAPAGQTRNREKALRDEYDTWSFTQYMRAEQETNGNLLNREGLHEGFDPARFFDGSASPVQVRKYGSEEVLRWFGEPGNERMSFSEFRAGLVSDKKSREATERMKSRTLSEFG